MVVSSGTNRLSGKDISGGEPPTTVTIAVSTSERVFNTLLTSILQVASNSIRSEPIKPCLG